MAITQFQPGDETPPARPGFNSPGFSAKFIAVYPGQNKEHALGPSADNDTPNNSFLSVPKGWLSENCKGGSYTHIS